MTTDPVDWDAAYAQETTPWDLGGVTPLLTDALAERRLGEPGRALVPGAGRAYDAGALAAAGWKVTAVDLSVTAAAYATARYPDLDYVVGDALDSDLVLARVGGPVDLSVTAAAYATARYPDLDYVIGDALDADMVLDRVGGPVDLLWDHTFFCALPPAMRPRVGALATSLIAPGSLLASGVFPLDRPDADGPPYRYVPEDMDAVLDGFEQIHLGPPTDSMVPGWHRRLAIWRRHG